MAPETAASMSTHQRLRICVLAPVRGGAPVGFVPRLTRHQAPCVGWVVLLTEGPGNGQGVCDLLLLSSISQAVTV